MWGAAGRQQRPWGLGGDGRVGKDSQERENIPLRAKEVKRDSAEMSGNSPFKIDHMRGIFFFFFSSNA